MILTTSHYRWLLDPGHGGMDGNRYVTAPHKMFDHGDFKIYEGVVNRQITAILMNKLIPARISFQMIPDWMEDTPLKERVDKADEEYKNNDKCIFLSIHSNAGGGRGNEIFTSVGQTKSDKIAQIFAEVYQEEFPQFPFRKDTKDGDDDKEADFYVLRKTDCPAILLENLFFDNRDEALLLMEPAGQEAFAEAIFKAIKRVEKIKPI